MKTAAQKCEKELQQLNAKFNDMQSAQTAEIQNLNTLIETNKKDAEELREKEQRLVRDKVASEATIQELRSQVNQLQAQHQQTYQQLLQLQQQQQQQRTATPSPSLASYRPNVASSANLPSPGIGSASGSSPGSYSSFPPSPSPFPGYVQSPSLRSSSSYNSPLHPAPLHGASPLSTSSHTPQYQSSPSNNARSSNNIPPSSSPIPPSASATPFASPSHNVLRNSEFSNMSTSASDLFAPRSTVELQVC